MKGKNQRNIFGEPLQLCSLDPLTGYYRDGYCNTGADDFGSHTIACVISEEFLTFQKSIGNDLMTPAPKYNFPGLKPGNRWAVCASRWLEAYNAGKPCRVILAATNLQALKIIPIEYLKKNEYNEAKDD